MSQPTPKEREAVRERDKWCQRCGKASDLSIHHRQGRRGAHPHRLSNLVLLCGDGMRGCHGWVHAHPTDAYAAGFMVPRVGHAGTECVPLIDLQGRKWGLLDDGTVQESPWAA